MYIYSKLELAISDLKLFSKQFAHEDRFCYLISTSGGWYIDYGYPVSFEVVEAAAINGVLFTRVTPN